MSPEILASGYKPPAKDYGERFPMIHVTPKTLVTLDACNPHSHLQTLMQPGTPTPNCQLLF